MKKFLKTLVVGLCLFTLLCCALPAAFAADKTSGSKKEENVYAIGMDAQGGICSTVGTYTNMSGKLESTTEQPTRTGYTFDGWTSSDGVTFANAGSTQTTFTMPDKAVTVTANWTRQITSPQTGDSSNRGLWISLCVISFAGLVGTTIAYAQTKRRREDEELPDPLAI